MIHQKVNSVWYKVYLSSNYNEEKKKGKDFLKIFSLFCFYYLKLLMK